MKHRLSVVIGKFYPPHPGHRFLIETAIAESDRVIAIVCEHPSQILSGELRKEALLEWFPDIEVLVTPDDLPNESEPWARRTSELLGRVPDAVFTSEEYGDAYANALGCVHRSVDPSRSSFPISGSLLRQDPYAHWDYLAPAIRAFLAKRVVLVGAESTGKTTLASLLADEFKTVWVPEFGREYCETRSGPWKSREFETIAKGQQALENARAREANQVLFCDTNGLATAVWHRRYMNRYSAKVEAIAAQDKVDLYLLALPDIPWVQDGTRDGEHIRKTMHEWFLSALGSSGRPYVKLSGPIEQRMDVARKAVLELLNENPFSGIAR